MRHLDTHKVAEKPSQSDFAAKETPFSIKNQCENETLSFKMRLIEIVLAL